MTAVPLRRNRQSATPVAVAAPDALQAMLFPVMVPDAVPVTGIFPAHVAMKSPVTVDPVTFVMRHWKPVHAPVGGGTPVEPVHIPTSDEGPLGDGEVGGSLSKRLHAALTMTHTTTARQGKKRTVNISDLSARRRADFRVTSCPRVAGL